MKLDPKARFLGTPHAKDFQEIVGNPAFQAAVEYGLLQIVENTPKTGSISEAGINDLRLQGARMFRDILLNLSEKTVSPKHITDSLPHPDA